jgi:hypothetical protein
VKFRENSYPRINRAVRQAVMALGIVALSPLGIHSAFAAGFTIRSDSTAAQTLSSGTGTVNSGVTLSVTGDPDAILVTGTSTLVNNGTILQTQTPPGASNRGVRVNTNNITLTFTNGSTTNSSALVQAADSDAIQVNKANDSVTLNNYGTFNSLNKSAGGAQAIDFNAITTGSNILNNFATGVLTASEADAVRPGVNGFVNNDGLIKSVTSTGSSSDGIDGQTNSGITIVNAASAGTGTGTGLIEGGRHGITGGNTTTGVYTMSITNNLGGTIQGDNGSGINIDGINASELVTILNHGVITGNGHDIHDGASHDGDGVDVDGLVNLTNTGTIRSLNSFSASGLEFSEGVTVGGGTITNSGTIEGSVAAGNTTALGRGITIAGVDKDVNDNPIPIKAPFGAATITNSGLIKGDTDSAIIFSSALASGFSHTITNSAGGVIQTGSTSAAAILTAADNVTITNSGTIDGTSSGRAITGGSGKLTLNVTGGAASILGDIAGGSNVANSMTIDPGAGNSFGYSGSISNVNTVETKSGTVTLSGLSTYSGATIVTGGILALNGANRLAAASSLQLNGGTLELENAGAAGQAFANLALSNSSIVDLGASSLTFGNLSAVGAGDTLTVLDWSSATSPLYAFRVLGDDTGNALFRSLLGDTTIDGLAAIAQFDGMYTNVSAVPLPETFSLLLSALGLLGVVTWRRKADATA